MLDTNEVVVGRTKQVQCMRPTSLFLAPDGNSNADWFFGGGLIWKLKIGLVSLLYDLTWQATPNIGDFYALIYLVLLSTQTMVWLLPELSKTR